MFWDWQWEEGNFRDTFLFLKSVIYIPNRKKLGFWTICDKIKLDNRYIYEVKYDKYQRFVAYLYVLWRDWRTKQLYHFYATYIIQNEINIGEYIFWKYFQGFTLYYIFTESKAGFICRKLL